MYITSVISNNSWKFHDDTMMGHSETCDRQTDRQTDGQMDWTILRAAWSQLKMAAILSWPHHNFTTSTNCLSGSPSLNPLPGGHIPYLNVVQIMHIIEMQPDACTSMLLAHYFPNRMNLQDRNKSLIVHVQICVGHCAGYWHDIERCIHTCFGSARLVWW